MVAALAMYYSLPLLLLRKVAACFCRSCCCQSFPEYHPIGQIAPIWMHLHANAEAMTYRMVMVFACVHFVASCDSPSRTFAMRDQSCPWPCRFRYKTIVLFLGSDERGPLPWEIPVG